MSSVEPKYRQIIESLRASIQAGHYRSGSRLPSEAELVRRFGVSRMTVVKAMQILQQDGLLTRRTGSGSYVADAAARTAPRKLVFGLIIPDLGRTEIFERICRGMANTPSVGGHSLSRGYSAEPNENKEDEAEQLCRQYIEQGVSGVFFAPVEFAARHGQVNRRVLKALAAARIPVVLLDRCVMDYPARSQYDLVSLDNRRAGFAMTDHMIKQGASRVAFLALEGAAEPVDARAVGYREALYANGLPIDPTMVLRGDPADGLFVKKALEDLRPDAFFCANDNTAAQLMQTLTGLRVKVPEEVRVTGVDDVRYASLLAVPLTTIHQPCGEIGAAAIAAMVDRIENPGLPARTILLNGRLVVRQSCGAGLKG